MIPKKRILICGAGGFIGRNLVKYYTSREDYDVYGTYLNNKPSGDLAAENIFCADLRNYNIALEVTAGMDVVINCAALTDGIGVYSQPGKTEEFKSENGKVNKNLISAASECKVKHFIFLSCTVMYHSSKIPLHEDSVEPAKIHPKYKLSAEMKLYGEKLCEEFAAHGITRYTAVRHTNIYGPYDKFDMVRGHVLAATIVKVMEARKEVVIWGTGKETRDFLHVSDLTGFINAALTSQRYRFGVFNAGSGRTYSVKLLTEEIIKLSGKTLTIRYDLNGPTVGTDMNISVEKARRDLGWVANIGLSDGLRRTMDWYINQPH